MWSVGAKEERTPLLGKKVAKFKMKGDLDRKLCKSCLWKGRKRLLLEVS